MYISSHFLKCIINQIRVQQNNSYNEKIIQQTIEIWNQRYQIKKYIIYKSMLPSVM